VFVTGDIGRFRVARPLSTRSEPPLAPLTASAAAARAPEPAQTEPDASLTRPGPRLRFQVAVIVIAAIVSVAALYLARAFVVPLIIGIFASYTLRPLVDWLAAWRMPRAIAAALVLSLLVGGIAWTIFSLNDDAVTVIEKLPQAAHRLRQKLHDPTGGAPSTLQKLQEAANELQAAAAEVAAKPGTPAAIARPPDPASGTWLRDYLVTQSALAFAVAGQAPIVLLLAYFLLASGEHFRRKVVKFVGPSLSRKKDALRMLEEVDKQIQLYMLAMLISNVLLAIGTWLAFLAMGMEHAGMWGVAAGVLHFIPYLGPVLIAFASGMAGFLQFDSLLVGLAVGGVSLLVSGVVGFGFMTWLQSRFARVNAAVLFIALLFFGWLWGVWGLLLGAPIVAIIKVVSDRVGPLHPVGELLGR
jgi:predicted PurR-regulated permease PerM